jgi:hypothetical protein
MGSVHGPNQPTGGTAVGVVPPEIPMLVGKVPRIEASELPAVSVQTVMVTAPVVGEGTTVEKVSAPERGAVKVILGTDVGGRMLNAAYDLSGVTSHRNVTYSKWV